MTEPEAAAENKKQERRVESEVAINAPVDEVWKALTEADGLKSWFPLEARVTPGLGGKMFASWGADCEGES
jgi:uncharacterized protein YndB with AHSA1/START domain